jgi:hypothetical protein
MRLDTKINWPTDRRSQRNFDFDLIYSVVIQSEESVGGLSVNLLKFVTRKRLVKTDSEGLM